MSVRVCGRGKWGGGGGGSGRPPRLSHSHLALFVHRDQKDCYGRGRIKGRGGRTATSTFSHSYVALFGGLGGFVCPVLLYVHRDHKDCLLYTSDAADEALSVDLGGRRIIKKKFF